MAFPDLETMGGGHIRVLHLPQLVNKVVFLTHHRRQVNWPGRGRNPGKRIVERVVAGGGRGQQGLGGHTPDIHTRPPERAAFDEDHRMTRLPGSNRGGHRRTARADYRQLNLIVLPHEPSPFP